MDGSRFLREYSSDASGLNPTISSQGRTRASLWTRRRTARTTKNSDRNGLVEKAEGKYARQIEKGKATDYEKQLYEFIKKSEIPAYGRDTDEIGRELIEYVIETMIKSIESDIDKYLYEYNLVINICKNSYRYFKIIDKIFEKLQNIYDESLEKDIITLKDYIKMYTD